MAFGSFFGSGGGHGPLRTVADRAPLATDDETSGYSAWSLWLDTSAVPASEVYRCISAAAGQAVWVKSTVALTDLGTSAAVDVPAAGNAGPDQVVLGSDTRLRVWHHL